MHGKDPRAKSGDLYLLLQAVERFEKIERIEGRLEYAIVQSAIEDGFIRENGEHFLLTSKGRKYLEKGIKS